MKKKSDKFVQLLHSFLTVFLPKQRNSSPHTILAAKQVWNMLLNYICTITGKKAETVVFSDVSRMVVLGAVDKSIFIHIWTFYNITIKCITAADF